MPRIFHPAEWTRNGRGSELQFFATDAEVASYLSALPNDLAPYDIVGSRLVPEGKKYHREWFVMSIADCASALVDGSAPHQFFVRSGPLIPTLPVGDEDSNAWFTLNGLVLMQHGHRRNGKREQSRIAFSNAVISLVTGEVCTLLEHRRVFDALRKRIKRDLCYVSIQRLTDGSEIEADHILMTEAAAEQGRRGELSMRPGPRRPKRR